LEFYNLFLYKQGTLTQEDILGTQKYQIADGSISEGTIIKLRCVQIGNRTFSNVKASVIHNSEAPLLLRQSALTKFGKVSIDYKNNEITFE
jgi:aspartyl protease family protein